MENLDNVCQIDISVAATYIKSAGWQNGDNRASGGSGGASGSASKSSTANTVTAGWPTQGKGTEDAPFIVNSTADWNYFANFVTGGYTFSGQFVKLNESIPVETMAGADDAKTFQGTFDGDGNTLTFNKGTAQSPFSEAYCAPFRHVKNAVIKDLHVVGTIYTCAQKAAGFVGESHGALTITGCCSSVAINSSKSGDGTHGGLVSTLSGSGNTILIDGCVFDGSFATTASTTNCGGFIGWPVWNKPYISNSLMKPSSVAEGMLINTFARRHDGYEPTITNCYYVATDNLPTNQGLGYSFASAPANIGTAGEAYTTSGITPYTSGLLYDGRYYMTPEAISLANTGTNDVVSIEGYFANVTLAERTLYKDGAWNTICLPFNVTLADSPLAGADARELIPATSGLSGTTLTLNFTAEKAVTELIAGTPYLIKWAKVDGYVDDDAHNIVNPVFTGVTISSTTPKEDYSFTGGKFVGIYSQVPFTAGDRSILYLGAANKLYWPNADMTLGACRAYFKLADGTTASEFNLNFDGDEDGNEATGVKTTNYTNYTNYDGAWYDMQGRKIANGQKPTAKGLYIHGGRKIVVK